MDNQACIDLLNTALDGTVNSVVQYFGISGAYIPPDWEDGQATMERIREEEALMAHEINDVLYELDGAAKVGVFPYWNVDLNYLDARFYARLAAQQQEGVVQEIEERLEGTRDHARVFRLLTSILERKRGHLDDLRGLIPPEPEPEPEAEEEESAEAASAE